MPISTLNLKDHYYQKVWQTLQQCLMILAWKPTGTAKTFSLSEIERATDHFRPDNSWRRWIWTSYQGVLDSGLEVAVKVLTRDDHQGGREFIAEVEM
ncbi:hypothetical protein KC19_6G211300 [Ceratodon purpureus]|uniref:Uncharacterized protein n=1 Tax=Ceratodon purpureus TaxID=3225 RepID=A0A8T0HJY2_CERPU|nr:hypothetical protein KC19_6G211300 [Ceratodon purpureus]